MQSRHGPVQLGHAVVGHQHVELYHYIIPPPRNIYATGMAQFVYVIRVTSQAGKGGQEKEALLPAVAILTPDAHTGNTISR